MEPAAPAGLSGTMPLLISTAIVVVTMLAAWITVLGLMYRLFGRLDTKIGDQGIRLEKKIEAQGTRLNTKIEDQGIRLEKKIEAQGTRLDTKIEAQGIHLGAKMDLMGRDIVEVRERLARVEGHMMASQGFIPSSHPPPDGGSPPDNPAPDPPETG